MPGTADLPIPSEFDDVTAEWMSRALGCQVDSVRAERIAEGVGMLTLLLRVHLSSRDPLVPPTVVVKMPSADPFAQQINAGYRFWEREWSFYSTFATQTPMRTPKCYYADFDEQRNEGVLVLEDVGDARAADQLGGFTMPEAKTVLSELARLHAAFWGKTAADAYESIPFINAEFYTAFFSSFYQQAWPVVAEKFGQALPPSFQELGDRLASKIPALMDALAVEPLTLVHFEPRGDNLLFTGDQDSPGVVVIDWQGLYKASGVWDYTWFVTQSLTVEDRRKHEQELSEFYLSELAAGGVEGVDPEDFQRAYRVSTLYAFVWNVIASAAALTDERLAALLEAMIDRTAAAIVDAQAMSVLIDAEAPSK